MKIRHGRNTDAAALSQIESSSYPQAEAADFSAIRKRLAAFPDGFWIAEEDGRILGFICGMKTDCKDLQDEMYENPGMYRETGKQLMIFSVVTAPERRNQHIASTLMRHVIEEAAADGMESIVLTCKEKLLPFYESFGFLNEGRSASVHGNTVWYQMRRALLEEKTKPAANR